MRCSAPTTPWAAVRRSPTARESVERHRHRHRGAPAAHRCPKLRRGGPGEPAYQRDRVSRGGWRRKVDPAAQDRIGAHRGRAAPPAVGRPRLGERDDPARPYRSVPLGLHGLRARRADDPARPGRRGRPPHVQLRPGAAPLLGRTAPRGAAGGVRPAHRTGGQVRTAAAAADAVRGHRGRQRPETARPGRISGRTGCHRARAGTARTPRTRPGPWPAAPAPPTSWSRPRPGGALLLPAPAGVGDQSPADQAGGGPGHPAGHLRGHRRPPPRHRTAPPAPGVADAERVLRHRRPQPPGVGRPRLAGTAGLHRPRRLARSRTPGRTACTGRRRRSPAPDRRLLPPRTATPTSHAASPTTASR